LKILMVKLSALGDVIHTLPALTALRRQMPGAQITWLVEEAASDLVVGHAALDRVLVWPRRQWTRQARTGRWLELSRGIRDFLNELRDTRYDLVIDFQGLAKTALWVTVARGVRKAGYGPGMRHAELSWLALNHRVRVVDPNIHAIDRNLNLIEALGVPRLSISYDVPIAAEAEVEADRLLETAGIVPGTSFVAINPMTRWPTKNWTPTQFATVARALRDHGLTPLFTGAAGDRAAIDAIADAHGGALPRVDGRTRLPVLAAMYRRARVVLSTDTGPMHLAVAVGARVVALFGPTAPGSTGPYGRTHIVLQAGVGCSPCFKRKCKTRQYEPHACMLRIAPDAVVAAILRQVEIGPAQALAPSPLPSSMQRERLTDRVSEARSSGIVAP
jgi:3-deoxy-D-manno-octulosonic-acid transferase/heptosyltransferase-1